jgi:hypothetical protein
MINSAASWLDRWALTQKAAEPETRFQVCAAASLAGELAATVRGVAVIYAAGAEGSSPVDKIYLVLESRAGSLRALCEKRLLTAKLPDLATLMVAWHGAPLADDTAETLQAACREQLVLASRLRRELRPAMR